MHGNDVSRRSFLKVGALGTSLSLTTGALGIGAPVRAKRSAIFIFLEGGPSHLDTFDLKPEAPANIRGEFRPIETNAGGVEICEHLPMLAKRADRYAIVRGITHNLADHGVGKQYVLTGNKPSQTLKYPEFGSVVAKEHPSAEVLPSYVSIDESFVGPGYLGSEFSPLTAEKPRFGFPYNVRGLSLTDGLTVRRFSKQRDLLKDLDRAFAGYEDLDDQVRGFTRFSAQAYRIISNKATRTAFDLGQEPEKESLRFGRHEFGQSLLLAARLVEAGVHFVTVRLRPAEFDFDTHQDNFSRLKTLLPPFDRGFAALLDRLGERGLLDETAVLCCGEFGRTPKINGQGGRDHWARAMCALMAGGDVKGGQVLGATDKTGSEPTGSGYSPDDVAASFYKNIGISPKKEFATNVGRPITLVREGTPIRGLF